MPGFLAGDQTLSVIAAWLRRLGYRPQFCGFVLNAGCSDRTLDRVERRVDTLWRSHGRRVALIGHSRGGHFARALAARRPDRVSHAISVGADLQGLFGASTPTLAAVDLARRVVHASGTQGAPPRERRNGYGPADGLTAGSTLVKATDQSAADQRSTHSAS